MTSVWVAGLVAGAIWLVLPPETERRLTPPTQRSWPGWLEPVPEALNARTRGLASGGLAVAVALWTSALGWGAAALVTVAGVVAYLVLGRVTTADQARRTAELLNALPQVCDLLAVTVTAGLPLRRAVEVVGEVVGGPAGEALDGVAARVRLGESESQAWAELEQESAWRSVAREVSRTVSSGLGLAPLLRDVAAEARRVASAAALVRARQVGVRSVLPLMVCFLPSFILLGVVPVVGGIVATVLP